MSASSSRSGGGGGASDLAQLRRRAAAPVQPRRVRRDPLRRPDRAHELLLPALRRRADDLDRIAVRCDADYPALVPLQHGDELRQLLRRPRAARAARRRRSACESSQPRRGSPAGSPPSAAATSPTSASARFRVIPRRGLRRAELRKPLLDPRGRLRPDSRHAAEPSSAAAASRSSGSVRDPERVPELAHPLRRDAEQRARRRRAPAAPAPPARRARRARPVSTSSRSRVSIPGPIPASSCARPARTSAATSAGVARIRSAARRYARTV